MTTDDPSWEDMRARVDKMPTAGRQFVARLLAGYYHRPQKHVRGMSHPDVHADAWIREPEHEQDPWTVILATPGDVRVLAECWSWACANTIVTAVLHAPNQVIVNSLAAREESG